MNPKTYDFKCINDDKGKSGSLFIFRSYRFTGYLTFVIRTTSPDFNLFVLYNPSKTESRKD